MRTIAFAYLAAVATIASADTELTYDGGEMSILVANDRAAIGGTQSQMLYKSGSPDITVVDHQRREYMVLDEKAVAGINRQNQAAMANIEQMKAQLATLPANQRAIAEQMLSQHLKQGATAPVELSVRKGGASKVGRWACQLHDVLQNGQPVQQLCIVSAKTLGISEQDFQTMTAAMNASRDMMSSMPGRAAPRMPDLNMLGGVPVQVKFLDNDRVSTLTGVSTQSVDLIRVSVPDGYSRQQMPQ